MSELALQLIEKEKQERTGKLDLGNCGLTDFPKKMFELDWLTELNFCNEYYDYNQNRLIKSLNKGAGNHIQETRLPIEFYYFQQLKILRINNGGANLRLSNCSVLEYLPTLTTLDLSLNKTKNYVFLEKLTSLKHLDLSGNKISDFSFLEKLTSLKYLDLSSNEIKDISFLKNLTSLNHLALRYNHISDTNSLERLTYLKHLDLSGNKISDIISLGNLTSLNYLDLSGNNISNIILGEKLIYLNTLHLSDNLISNIIFLEKLTSLNSIDLSGNQISDISSLGKLTSLISINLSDNQISDIHSLGKLISLISLDLSDNQISDISSLEKLTSLNSLYLSDNQISDIHFLERLTCLNSLYLGSNRINDYSFLRNMKYLNSLHLGNNKISDIRFLENLTSLNSLYLRSNKISDIHFLEKLTSLNSLDLVNNKLTNVKGLIPFLKEGIPVNLQEYGGEGISLYGNPITDPPVNIVEQGSNAILAYFEQLTEQGSEKLCEARIVIVGEPGAGKTTLYNKLIDESIIVPDHKQQSTHGININQKRFFKHTHGVNIKTSVWDFGGQDTQNYLHQYFYAKDNLFILVCDLRSEKYRFDYWFEMISRLCTESRIIIIRNQNERITACQSLNLKEYEERFPTLKLNHIDVDFKINDARWHLLKQTIEENLSVMQRVNQEVPKTWKPIRDAIEEKKQNKSSHIPYNEYEKICIENGLEKPEHQQQCLEYLHWLGYALHYDDLALSSTIFIDPEWITKGLYEILREDNYKPETKGRFSKNDINAIWKGRKYSYSDRELLLSLLLKDRFEVCYKVENTDNYLVPILISNIKKEPDQQVKTPYILRFKFPFMPFGFFSRLIVRLFDKVWNDYVWLTGVWLNDNNTIAKLEHFRDIQSGEEVFEIAISGDKKGRKYLLAEIRNEIFRIRKLLFPNLIIEEQIPCFCSVCSELKTPYFHSRNDLEKMAEKNQFKSQCKKSGGLIPTDQLLDSIIDTEELKKQFNNMGIVINNQFKNIGNPRTDFQANSNAHAFATAKSEVNITINNILGEVQNLKEDFEDEKKLLLKFLNEDEYEVTLKDIVKAEKAVQELETAKKQNQDLPQKSKNRLKGFIDDLSNENSTLHKGLKLLRRGRDYGINLAELYNNIAANTGMPQIPPLALEVIKKI